MMTMTTLAVLILGIVAAGRLLIWILEKVLP